MRFLHPGASPPSAGILVPALLLLLTAGWSTILSSDPPAPDPEEGAATAESRAAAPPADPLARAREILEEDDFESALAEARKIAGSGSPPVELHALLGDILYRRGDFDEAEAAYRRSVEADDGIAAGHFGLGRIMRTLGRYGEAAGYFHKAAALDPNNPEYIRILANHLAKREDVIELLTRYLEMPEAGDEKLRKNVAAWIALLKYLGDEPMREIVKAGPTELSMNVLRGQAYLKAGINKKRNQRFAFDTGSTGMTISPRLARSAKVERIRPFDITGMGGKGTVSGDLVLIRKLTLGGITLRNVTATVAEPKGLEEGLLGPAVLSSFLIRLDLRSGSLGLRLREKEEGSGGSLPPGSRSLEFRNVGGQFVIPARLNGVTLNAMLDTGSQSSLASFSSVPRVEGLELMQGSLPEKRSFGIAGRMERKTIRSAELAFAGREFRADGMPCVNLSGFSRAVQSEIYLVIGFPELEPFVLTIDYGTNRIILEERGG